MQPLALATEASVGSAQSELVARAAGGDEIAFERLVVNRTDRAFRTACAILGNETDARDATQDAFIAVWRELPRLRDHERFDGWFSRILVNACRAHLRSRRRVREISIDAAAERRAPGPGVSEQLGDTDVLSHAFDRLDPAKRAILVLHYLEHAPVATIAASLGVPVGTAKWRLSDARAALERALRAEEGGRR